MRTPACALLLSALVVVGCGKGSNPKSSGPQSNPAEEKFKRPATAVGSTIDFVLAKPKGQIDGSFKFFTVSFSPFPARDEDLGKCKLEVEIATYSLWAADRDLAARLKSPEFIDVRGYPTARFVSSAIAEERSGENTHKITGDLTLHGKTRTLTIPAKVSLTAEAVTIRSQFAVNLKDFDISLEKEKLNDEVKVKTALRAVKP
jgi:polyisoprenoid-binding protein YceI